MSDEVKITSVPVPMEYLAEGRKIMLTQKQVEPPPEPEGWPWWCGCVVVGVVFVIVSLILDTIASGAETVLAVQLADSARTKPAIRYNDFAALKASAAETAKLIESIPVVTFEPTPHEKPRDYGIGNSGRFTVSGPRGSFLAERLAQHLAEKYPTMTRQVQISIRYSTQPIVHVNPWRGREDYAINLWLDITQESDAFGLSERVLDIETAGVQRTNGGAR